MDYIPLINIIILLIGFNLFAISFKNYTFAFSVWLVLLPVVVQINSFEGWEILPAQRIVTCLLFMVAFFKLRRNWRKIPDLSLFWYYLLFIFCLFLSSIFSEIPLQSAGRTLTFFVPLMMGIMALAAIVENENGLRIIIKAMIAGFTISIAYAIIEFLFQDNYLVSLGLIFSDADYLAEDRYGLGGRITSFLGQPVYAALYFLVVLPLILFYRKYYVKNPVIKATYLMLLALGVFVILLTGTRSAYLTIPILPLIYLFYQKRTKLITSKIFYAYVVALVLLLFLLPQELISFTQESFQVENPDAAAGTSAASNVVYRIELTMTFIDSLKRMFFWDWGQDIFKKVPYSLTTSSKYPAWRTNMPVCWPNPVS